MTLVVSGHCGSCSAAASDPVGVCADTTQQSPELYKPLDHFAAQTAAAPAAAAPADAAVPAATAALPPPQDLEEVIRRAGRAKYAAYIEKARVASQTLEDVKGRQVAQVDLEPEFA